MAASDAGAASDGDVPADLSPSARAVYRELASADHFLSSAELAERTGIAPSTVRDAVKAIREHREVGGMPSPDEGRRYLYWFPEHDE